MEENEAAAGGRTTPYFGGMDEIDDLHVPDVPDVVEEEDEHTIKRRYEIRVQHIHSILQQFQEVNIR